jgi:hypothetical protein
MSNVAVIRQMTDHIEVWDNHGTSYVSHPAGGKRFEDEMQLLEYVIDYAQGFGDDTLVAILDAVCEQSLNMIINTVPYEHNLVMPVFRKMGFWE